MTTGSSQRLQRDLDAVWSTIRSAVATGLADSRAARQLGAFAHPGDGADARPAVVLQAKQVDHSIARQVTAVLADTYDLYPAGLVLTVDKDGMRSADDPDPVASILRWAASVRESELGWLISWIDRQTGVASESTLDSAELAAEAALGRSMVVPEHAAAVAVEVGLTHLVRPDEAPEAVRLPSTFRYVRHADFDLAWTTVDERAGKIELVLTSRVRLTGWVAAEARRYQRVELASP